MGNSITLFKESLTQLDEVYQAASLTACLDGNAELVKAGANANELIIPKMSMDGMADYSRNSGYADGDVTLTNETVACNYDRGRMFAIDSMDNIETAGVAFGRLASEFIRTKVVPELDATRFAQYAGTSGISKATAATLSTGANVVAALRTAVSTMDEDEVPLEDRVLFITPTLLGLVEDLDTTSSKEVLKGFSQIVKVPQTRFYTAIELKDGTTSGETGGGYAKATAGTDINFMVVQKSAPIQFPKRTSTKIVTPEQNQNSDAYKFGYRLVAIADVYENKVAGIYLHAKASA